ncbi:MAG TPA: hypothetical protein VKU01_26175 [Bryobacteraceae bacterium]|nr:hypothetical protein [Bryobacteraceae bacterium]
MGFGKPTWILIALVAMPGWGDNRQADTTRLAEHLARFRTEKPHELSAPEFYTVQRELLAWIHARVGRGQTVDQLNREMKAARLVSDSAEMGIQQSERSFAGFLGEIRVERVSGNDDVRALVAGIYTGVYCNYDETAMVYGRDFTRRIAVVNAERSYSHGHQLQTLAAGGDDLGNGSVLASAWVASSCASSWNGSVFRIDRVRRQAVENILARDVLAYDLDPVKIAVGRESVTFQYTAGSKESDVLMRAAVAAYEIRGGRALRMAPLAPLYGGFVEEWLELGDAEAGRWSTPEAARAHHGVAAIQGSFTWTRAAECPGSREIALEWGDSGKTAVFRIRGDRAVDLRMVSVSDRMSSACREVDPRLVVSKPLR